MMMNVNEKISTLTPAGQSPQDSVTSETTVQDSTGQTLSHANPEPTPAEAKAVENPVTPVVPDECGDSLWEAVLAQKPD